MPRNWLYYIALLLPLIGSATVLYSGLDQWLWYNEYQDYYYSVAKLKVNPAFVQYLGGWPFPVFVMTMMFGWTLCGAESLKEQFLLLPIFYAPFAVIGDFFATREFHAAHLYTFPLVIIPAGYLYIGTWMLFIRLMDKFRLVL